MTENTQTISTLNDDLAAIRKIAEVHKAPGLTREDREDIGQVAQMLLLRSPYDPFRKGKKTNKCASRKTHLENMYKWSLYLWRESRRLKIDLQEVRSAKNSGEYLRLEKEFESLIDPLTRTRKKLGFGLDDQLESGRYKVEFKGETPDFAYVRQPYYVPRFEIVPRDYDEYGREIVARRTGRSHRGKRRNYTRGDLSAVENFHLDSRRSRLARYLQEMIPNYLSQFGYSSLPRKLRQIVGDINSRNLSPAKIQAKRRLPKSTFYAYMAHLEKRGWVMDWHEKKQRETLQYKPPLDGCTTLQSPLSDLDFSDVQALIRLAGEDFNEMLYEDAPNEAAIVKECYAAREGLSKSLVSRSSDQEYDRKLRSFICEFVERPVQTGAPIEELEAKFARLTKKKRQVIFCEALRRGLSMWDVISDDFTATFAEELDPRREAESEALKPTLATLELAFNTQAGKSPVREELTLGSLLDRATRQNPRVGYSWR